MRGIWSLDSPQKILYYKIKTSKPIKTLFRESCVSFQYCLFLLNRIILLWKYQFRQIIWNGNKCLNLNGNKCLNLNLISTLSFLNPFICDISHYTSTEMTLVHFIKKFIWNIKSLMSSLKFFLRGVNILHAINTCQKYIACKWRKKEAKSRKTSIHCYFVE